MTLCDAQFFQRRGAREFVPERREGRFFEPGRSPRDYGLTFAG